MKQEEQQEDDIQVVRVVEDLKPPTPYKGKRWCPYNEPYHECDLPSKVYPIVLLPSPYLFFEAEWD